MFLVNFQFSDSFTFFLSLLEMLDTAVQFWGKIIHLFIYYLFIYSLKNNTDKYRKQKVNIIQKQINKIKKQYLSNVLQNKIDI